MPNPKLPPGAHGEIRVKQRKTQRADGTTTTTWRARTYWCDPATGRRRERAATGATANQAKRALIASLTNTATTTRGTRSIGPMTPLAAAAAVMFAEKQARVAAGHMSPTTLELYEGLWRRHIDPALGAMAIAWCDVPRCDEFLQELRSRKGKATASNSRSVLSQVLAVAIRYGAIPAPNPVSACADIPGDRRRHVKALVAHDAVNVWRGLSRLAVDGKCNQLVPDLWLWMLGTGDRISNALAAHWAWIDLQEGTARLGPNVIRVRGEPPRLSEGTSKSQRAEGVRLPSQVIAMLLTRQVRADYNPTGLVFPHRSGGFHDPDVVTGKMLRPALRNIGYGHVTSHWARRTVGSVLGNSGLSLLEVAGQLRHADSRTTERSYVEKRASNPRVLAAIEAMLATETELGEHDDPHT